MILQTGLEDFIQSSIYDFKNMSTIKKFWVVCQLTQELCRVLVVNINNDAVFMKQVRQLASDGWDRWDGDGKNIHLG